MQEYMVDPRMVPFSVPKDRDECSMQTFVLMSSLMTLTSITNPALLNDWSHLHAYPELVAAPERRRKVLACLQEWQVRANNACT